MKTIAELIFNTSRNIVWSISVFIAGMFIIGVGYSIHEYFYKPQSQKHSASEYKLIDIDQTAYKLAKSDIRYTAEGKILICNQNQNPEYEIYDQQTRGFSPAEQTDINSQLFNVENVNLKGLYVNSNYSRQITREKIIPTFVSGDYQVWVYDNQAGCFTGYRDRKVIGYFGQNGFVSQKELAGYMDIMGINARNNYRIYGKVIKDSADTAGEIRNVYMLSVAKGCLFYTDFAKQTHAAIAGGDGAEEVMGWTPYKWNKEFLNSPANFGSILVMYKGRAPELFYLTNNGFEKFSIKMEGDDFASWNYSMYQDTQALPPDSFYLVADNMPYNQFRDLPYNEYLDRVWGYLDKKGVATNVNFRFDTRIYKVDRQTGDCRLFNEYNNIKLKYINTPPDMERYRIFELCQSPAILCMARYSGVLYIISNSDYWSYYATTGYVFTGCIISTILMLLHNRNRRQSGLQTAGWVIFVLLFNVAGLLTYLIFNHSRLIKCLSCNKARHVRSDACPHCQTPLPVPALEVTDIVTR